MTDLVKQVKDIELTATIPLEMVNAQQKLITWCDMKLGALRADSTELLEATEHAKKMKWKSGTLQRQYEKSLKRVSYYAKIKAALLEGFYIVPNFPIQMFAIKTKLANPKHQTLSYWADHEQGAQELTIGSGDYQNPIPLVKRNVSNNAGKEEKYSYPASWDAFEFPITMAKPNIMQATTRAMALKIFDRIGIMPDIRDRDPVIIGQIIQKQGCSTKITSFMIAWHLNTNVL